MPNARRRSDTNGSPRKRRNAPARSLEARENQLILLATNLAERQLMEGTASSQIIAHYLRLGTTREKLEQERLRQENELSRAKTESIRSGKKMEELYENAMSAFRVYSGHGDEENYNDDDDM